MRSRYGRDARFFAKIKILEKSALALGFVIVDCRMRIGYFVCFLSFSINIEKIVHIDLV